MNKNQNKRVALGGDVDVNVHSVFEDHLSERDLWIPNRTLTHMSEWDDYHSEFEWSVPGVEEENTTESKTRKFTRKQ